MERTDVEEIVRRAASVFNRGKADQARQLCETGLSRRPDEPTLNHLLAAILFAAGMTVQARHHIGISLQTRADHAPAHLLAARIARAEQSFVDALSHLDRAMHGGVTLVLLLERARTLDYIADPAQQRDGWRAVLESDPHHREAMARLGRLAWEGGDAAEAARLLATAVVGDAPASAWFDLGLARQDLGDCTGAAVAYRQALAKKPDDAEAAVNLGIVLQQGGDLDGALASYGAAYRLRPTTFGTIAMALTSGSHGRLWLDEEALRRSLGG